MARKNPRRNIVRIVPSSGSPKAPGGWAVRLQRRGVKTQRYFSDSAFGGNRNALAMAKEFRDQIESDSRKYSVRELAQKPSARNQSGVVGVRLQLDKKLIDGEEYQYWFWIAQWIDGHGNRKARSFSVHRHGDEEAYRLACLARRKGVSQANR